MPVTVAEKHDSREWGTNGGERLYIIQGTADEATARAALEASPLCPLYHQGFIRRECTVAPVRIDEDDAASCVWDGTAGYERPESARGRERPQTGERVVSFDTSGGTEHITQSIWTVHKYAPPGKTAPDFKGAIGCARDSVQGCDVVTPTFKFSITAYIADGDMTEEYIGKLYALTGKVNAEDLEIVGFGSFNAGELLFLGVAGAQRGDGADWEVQWHFAATPNRSGITVGDMENIWKGGWDHLWISYDHEEDEAAKRLPMRPVAAYVEMVYEPGDFGDLEP